MKNVFALLALMVCAPMASAQVIYYPDGSLVDAAEPGDMTLKERTGVGSCKPWQPHGVIPVVKDPRPFAAGPSFRRPELFVHYPPCADNAAESTYYHMIDQKPGDLPRAAKVAPKPSKPDEVVRALEMSDKATDVTPNMALPRHPDGARNPADKGMAVIRPFIPLNAFRKAPAHPQPPKPVA